MKEIIYTQWQNRDINDIVDEFWVDIPYTNGTYKASNYGRIKSLCRRFYYTYENNTLTKHVIPLILKQVLSSNGYLVCSIIYPQSKFPFWQSVHRLICQSFKESVKGKPFVHHVKNVTTYNNTFNLMWVTPKENSDYKKLEHGNYEVINISKPNNSPLIPNRSLFKNGYTYIYGVTNDKNEIIYVGKSDNPTERLANHKVKSRGDDSHWGNKVNINSISFVILKQCKVSEWMQWEEFYIKQYRIINPSLFNISDGANTTLPHDIILKKSVKLFKKVLQYDRNGNFLKEWKSLKDAAKYAGVNSGTFSGSIKRSSLTANSIWKIKKNDTIPMKISPYKYLTGLTILQYSLHGIFMKEWKNATDAHTHLHVTTSQIYISLKHEHKTAANSFWRLKTDAPYENNILIPRPNSTFKPIFQILSNGNKKLWPSIKEAAIGLKITAAHISEGIRENKKAAGFYWEKDLSHKRWQCKHGKLS